MKYVRRNLWQGLDWAGKSVWVRLVRDDWVVVTAGGQVISEHPLEPVLRRTVIDDVHHDSCGGGRATGRCQWCLG